MKNTHIGIGLFAVAILLAGVVLPRPLPPSIQVVKEIIEKEKLGAFVGPDILSDFLTFNGIQRNYFRRAMVTATTTPCVIIVTATSTLVFATADFDISSSTQATVATFAKNPATTGSYATTTVLAQLGIAAGAKASIFVQGTSTVNLAGTPAPTGSGTDAAFTFVPNDKLILGFAGGQHPTSGQPTGVCQAEFLNVR